MTDRPVPFSPLLPAQLKKQVQDLMITVASLSSDATKFAFLDSHIPPDNPSLPHDVLRYRSTLLLLRDLLNQGWTVSVEDRCPHLHYPEAPVGSNAKDWYRQALLHERNKKLTEPSVCRFIRSMERERKNGEHKVSIRQLVVDPAQLVNSITTEGPSSVRPYLQIIQSPKERDAFTGLRLLDIWRYFRLTWSLPFRATPGRNLFVLVRDQGQPNHPLMGIAALGNSIVQITCRDNAIGWTLESLRTRVESMGENEASSTLMALTNAVHRAIAGIKWNDLIPPELELSDSDHVLSILHQIASESYRDVTPQRVAANAEPEEWEQLSLSPLFRRKRAKTLAGLLRTKRGLAGVSGDSALLTLRSLLTTSAGRSAVSQALQAIKKEKIGSNMMDIIVCGAVPPYNHLLAGKLTALLMMSPELMHAYEERYKGQVSVIASGMKGEPVNRDSRLAYLGTTSLYENGSSQYNRVFIPPSALGRGIPETKTGYEAIGFTKGYGTVYLSDETVNALATMITSVHGSRLVHNTYGEGTSPRLRLVRTGLDLLGLPADDLLRHNNKRIVYGINLASNTSEFLRGEAASPKYLLTSQLSDQDSTQAICDFWRRRWLSMRVQNQAILERLESFRVEDILLGDTEM